MPLRARSALATVAAAVTCTFRHISARPSLSALPAPSFSTGVRPSNATFDGIATAGAVRPLVLYPDPGLRTIAMAVSNEQAEIVRSVAADLVATARAHCAMGLAAPQLGIALRIFAVRRPLARNEGEARALRTRLLRMSRARRSAATAERPLDYIVAMNPKLLSASPATEIGIESCLSVPDYPALVRRHSAIDVEYVDAATGAHVTEHLSGLPAVVFQHELDHLDGVLLLDRELRAVARGADAEVEFDAAYQRWMLGAMRFYGGMASGEPKPT